MINQELSQTQQGFGNDSLDGASATQPIVFLDYNVASKDAQTMLLWFSMGLTCILYALLTVFGLRNFFKYIVKQQNQLKLLYVLAILASAVRLGRYVAMIYLLASGVDASEIHTQLSLMVDLVVSCLLGACGLCLILIMFKLYTYLQCWAIFLHQQRQSYNNMNRLLETRERQQQATKRFIVLKYAVHCAIVLIGVFTVTQLILIYTHSAYAQTSPLQVTTLEFTQSQADLPWYSFWNIKLAHIEQGVFCLVDALLLYTSIFFLVAIMNDLGQQNAIMYVEGSSSMENEKKRLKTILMLFGTSFVFRAGFELSLGIYMLEVQKLGGDYPGFFELCQSLYFVLTDLIPLISFFHMHHTLYGDENAEGQNQQVQMQVNPDAARAYHLQNNNAQYLQTVLLNIIEATESSQHDQGSSIRSDSLPYSIEESYNSMINDNQLYQTGFGNRSSDKIISGGQIEGHLSDLNSMKVAQHRHSYRGMRQCGLLSKETIRQIQSDIVTIEALSRLQASELQSAQLEEDSKSIVGGADRSPDDLYTEQLIVEEDVLEKPGRLSEDLRAFNREKNHFSKSTADDSDIGVRDLECLLQSKDVRAAKKEHNNRSSSVVDFNF